MVELVTIFKIEKLNDKLEQLIPIKVIPGFYDEDEEAFIAEDDTVYKHLEEVKYPQLGYFGRRKVYEDDDIEYTEEEIMKLARSQLSYYLDYIYVRHIDYPNMIFSLDPGKDFERIFDIDSKSSSREVTLDIPMEIEKQVKKTIKGQDEAVRKIVTSLWTSIKFDNLSKRNMLIVGPSGVGKTAIFKKIQKILGIPMTIFPVPGLSQAGYEGRNTDEILKQLYFDCDGDESLLSGKSIVILDEIDKLAYNQNSSGDVSTLGVQNELLKIVEGVKRTVEINQEGEYFDIDTSNIIFVGIGAFSELYQKEKTSTIGFNSHQDEDSVKRNINSDRLIKYGLKKELVGRFPIIVELNAMTKEILKDIVINSDESELKLTIKALKSLGIKIRNLDEVIDLIVDDAISKEIGARGLVSTINDIFLEIFYTVANSPDKYSEILIGANILNDNKDFRLIRRATKVKKKTK